MRDDTAGLAELLEALDGAVCMGLFDLAETLAPPPLNAHGHIDFRTRAARQWFGRWEAVLRAAIDLIDAGLAVAVSDSPTQLGITEAGRRYIAEMRALP
jgi:hypothetical protein